MSSAGRTIFGATPPVDLGACGNTLDAQKLDVAQLLPGFVRIDEGGVETIAICAEVVT